jgi:hypothetical protein
MNYTFLDWLFGLVCGFGVFEKIQKFLGVLNFFGLNNK